MSKFVQNVGMGCTALVVLVQITLFVAVVYVAWHFITKFW